VRCLRPANLKEKSKFGLTPGNSQSINAHKGSVRSLAFGADGRCLASAGDDGVIRLWNTQTWKLTAEL
jgi:WD40 repeat protein